MGYFVPASQAIGSTAGNTAATTQPQSNTIDFTNLGNPYSKSNSTSSSSQYSSSGLPANLMAILTQSAGGLGDTSHLTTAIGNLMGMPNMMANMGNNIASSWGGNWGKPLSTGQAAPAPASGVTPTYGTMPSYAKKV